MEAIGRFGAGLILAALCACGSDGNEQNADPILGAWDDPATKAGMEFVRGGRLIDLTFPDVAGSWTRTSPGAYTLEFGTPDGKREPFRMKAKLDGDLLRLDAKHLSCLRRRTWTLENPGPRSAEVEGKLVVFMTQPAEGSRVATSGHYLQHPNGDLTAIEPQAGMTLVRFDKSEFRSRDGRFPMQLGKRYRVHGIGFSTDEFIAELERLGHESVSLTRPMGCDRYVDVYRMVELEELGPAGGAPKPRSGPGD